MFHTSLSVYQFYDTDPDQMASIAEPYRNTGKEIVNRRSLMSGRKAERQAESQAGRKGDNGAQRQEMGWSGENPGFWMT